MSITKKTMVSGKTPVTPVQQNRHKITIPIDDPRNNKKFLNAHPDVKVAGKTPKRVPKHDELHPAKKHKPSTKINKVPAPKHPHAHLPPGKPKKIVGEIDDIAIENEPNDIENNGEPEEGENFLFHELAHESYDLETHSESQSSDSQSYARSSEGVETVPLENAIQPPSALSVDNATMTPQLDSMDGIPTYTAVLNFDSGNFSGDYEIRVIKQ